jgi:hypothetical protein
VDTWRCKECIELDVVTGEAGYRRSDLIGALVAAEIDDVLTVSL